MYIEIKIQASLPSIISTSKALMTLETESIKIMSSDGRYHAFGCKNKSKCHSDGKWCWTEADVESLEKQYAEQKTWNQIGDCQAKMNALLLDAAGRANSIALINLAKRPRTAKKQVDNTKELDKKHESAGVKEDHQVDDQDEEDDKEAEEAIKKILIKIESDSE
ncbi:hypothetical protein N0V82_003957 [Gnomoniopsis sp. IMI 355080]|nr:hypothetical protein N0V82_003957 [Gnomoniopsis sp. IMI 355080]